MDAFAMLVAGLRVRVEPLYQDVVDLCADYRLPLAAADETPSDLVVCPTRDDIERERVASDGSGPWCDGYLETLAVLRAIADVAPLHGRLLAHGALLAYGGRSWLFCAPSGTGKSTHIALWCRLLGEGARVLNGDKPLLEFTPHGVVGHGTPWAGKEGWQTNASAPLAGICLLGRAPAGESRIDRIDPAEGLTRLLGQLYLPPRADAGPAALELADRLVREVPLFDLHVDVSAEAVRTSFEALTGLSFDEACVSRRD